MIHCIDKKHKYNQNEQNINHVECTGKLESLKKNFVPHYPEALRYAKVWGRDVVRSLTLAYAKRLFPEIGITKWTKNVVEQPVFKCYITLLNKHNQELFFPNYKLFVWQKTINLEDFMTTNLARQVIFLTKKLSYYYTEFYSKRKFDLFFCAMEKDSDL